MQTLTREMINLYNIKKIKIDFMGYTFKDTNNLTYHHLIISRKDGGKRTLENGAILTEISHEYLHLMEFIEPDIFYYITSEIIDETIKGKINIENLKNIRELLIKFEQKHKGEKRNKGKILIKPKYLIRPELDTIKLIWYNLFENSNRKVGGDMSG